MAYKDNPEVECKNKCGHTTRSKDGICTICKLFGIEVKVSPNEPMDFIDIEPKKEESMAKKGKKKYKYPKKRCSVHDCKKQAWKDGMCYRHFNAKNLEFRAPGFGSLDPIKDELSFEKAFISWRKNRSHEPRDLIEQTKINKLSTSDNLYLGQLLYISDKLDRQIKSALETDKVDASELLDIRFRVGEVLRVSLPTGV